MQAVLVQRGTDHAAENRAASERRVAGVLQGQIRRDPHQIAGHHVLRLDPSQQLLDLEFLVGGSGGLDQEPPDEREPDAPGEIPTQGREPPPWPASPRRTRTA